jgi:hypothetical protein
VKGDEMSQAKDRKKNIKEAKKAERGDRNGWWG